MLGNDDIFSFLGITDSQDNLFNTNVKSVLGQNIVLNFIGRIENEIRSFGYSDSANEIARFYESCLKKGGIVTFFTNPVMEMILQEIQYKPTVKNYIKQRFLDYIEEDKRKKLDYTFNNNESIYSEYKNNLNKYVKNEHFKKREINKIMKEKNVSYEEAEKIYKNKKIKQEMQNSLKDFREDFKKQMQILIDEGKITQQKEGDTEKKFTLSDFADFFQDNDNAIEIDLNQGEDDTDSTTDNPDNFFGI